MILHVGVDMGTRRVAWACPELVQMGKYKVKDSTPIEAAGYILGDWLANDVFRRLHHDPEELHLWAERPFVGRPHGNVRTAVGQALTLGGVLAQGSGTWHLVEQAEWKKAVVGRGNASKGDVAEWLADSHRTLSEAADGDQDLVDAICLGLYGPVVAARG